MRLVQASNSPAQHTFLTNLISTIFTCISQYTFRSLFLFFLIAALSQSFSMMQVDQANISYAQMAKTIIGGSANWTLISVSIFQRIYSKSTYIIFPYISHYPEKPKAKLQAANQLYYLKAAQVAQYFFIFLTCILRTIHWASFVLLEYLKRRDKVCGICSPCGLLEQVFLDDIKLHLFIKIKLLISLTDFANLATFRASLLKTSLIVKSIQKVNSIASFRFSNQLKSPYKENYKSESVKNGICQIRVRHYIQKRQDDQFDIQFKMGFDKSGVRRRFKPRIGARRPGFRKGSGDFKRNQDEDQRGNFREGGRRIRDNQTNRRPLKGRRLIRKPRERPQQPVDKEELAQERKNQMDRQMRQYWIKSGSKKGNEEVKKDTKLATKKMNEEMDEYWKKAKEKKQQAVELAAEKKAPAA